MSWKEDIEKRMEIMEDRVGRLQDGTYTTTPHEVCPLCGEFGHAVDMVVLSAHQLYLLYKEKGTEITERITSWASEGSSYKRHLHCACLKKEGFKPVDNVKGWTVKQKRQRF